MCQLILKIIQVQSEIEQVSVLTHTNANNFNFSLSKETLESGIDVNQPNKDSSVKMKKSLSIGK